jgi:competence protein ComEA
MAEKRRREWILLSVGLVVIAAVILYSALHQPSMRVSSVPQTEESSIVLPDKSRYAVHINAATREELIGVKYITEDVADAILKYRAENGDFVTEEELLEVSGIGEKTLERIRPYIVVD